MLCGRRNVIRNYRLNFVAIRDTGLQEFKVGQLFSVFSVFRSCFPPFFGKIFLCIRVRLNQFYFFFTRSNEMSALGVYNYSAKYNMTDVCR